MKAVKGIVTTVTKLTEEKKYRIINRSQTDRTLAHRASEPHQPAVQVGGHTEAGGGYARVLPLPDPGEGRRNQDLHRQGRAAPDASITLTNNAEDQIRYFMNLAESTPALKQKLKEAMEMKSGWDMARRELNQVVADLNRLNADQDRIRKNLRETPKEAEVYQTYLKKLSDQEKEIDQLTEKQKKLADFRIRSPQEVRGFPGEPLGLSWWHPARTNLP